MAFIPVDLGWGQGLYGGSTSLPPRGYVLPPPPGYNPQQVRQRAPEAAPVPRARTVEEPRTSKKSVATVTPKKKVEPALAKSKPGASESSNKKATSVARSTQKVQPKSTSKQEVAKAVAPKKSTDKPSSKATVATNPSNSSKRRDVSPEPILKKSLPSKTEERVKEVATAKSPDKISKPDLSKVYLGESPSSLHAPATRGVKPSVAKAAVPLDDANLPPPVLTDSPMLQPMLSKGSDEVTQSGVVTTAAQLPSAVRRSSTMMPLSLPATTEVSEPPTTPATEPTTVSAADHAAAQMKLTLAALVAPPRANIIEELALIDTPPETHFEPEPEPSARGGGSTPLASSSAPQSELLPTPAAPVIASKPKISTPVEVVAPPQPKERTVAMVKPNLAAVRPAAYRPDSALDLPQTSAEEFRSEATFSAPDTPPAPTKPAVKLSPSLGALSIDAERADSETASNRVTFNGNVTMTCTRFTLKADKVVANMQAGDDANGVQKVVSEGHVVVNMNAPDGQGPGYIATGNQATYDPETETLRITGWPKIEEGNKALVASAANTEILIDTKSGRLTTTGSTKTLIK
jgi:lipopolysaccharide transport protein LptA